MKGARGECNKLFCRRYNEPMSKIDFSQTCNFIRRSLGDVGGCNKKYI